MLGNKWTKRILKQSGGGQEIINLLLTLFPLKTRKCHEIINRTGKREEKKKGNLVHKVRFNFSVIVAFSLVN